MKMIELLRQEFGNEFEVGHVITPLLDGELLSNKVTRATGLDQIERCVILVRYTPESWKTNELLKAPMVWRFERSKFNDRWILNYIE